MEKFKWIEGYKGLYKIGDKGNVMSFHHNKDGKILKRSLLRSNSQRKKWTNNYYMVTLRAKDKPAKSHLVHRLVAEAFIPNPNPEELTQIDHINFDTLDNGVDNLQWITPGANCRRSQGHTYHVTNLKTGETTVYGSRRLAARMTGINYSTLFYWIRENHLERAEGYGYKITEVKESTVDPGFK